MESRCGSLPNAKPVPKLPDPQPTAGLNETVPERIAMWILQADKVTLKIIN